MTILRAVQTLLYKNIFKLIRLTAVGHTEIWYRNSLYFNNLSSLRSDIDLTILGNSREEIKKTIKRIHLLKKFIPIIGEINAYKEDSLIDILAFANFYELERDPILQERASSNVTPNQEQKKVFLSRMLLANKHNLDRGIFDKKKWAFYFSIIGEPTPSSIDDAFRFLGASSPQELESSLIFNPVKNLSQALQKDQMEGFLEKIKTLSTNDQLILIENLRWEISGVCSQIYHSDNCHNIIQHFENIKKILKSIESPLANDLERLIFDITALKQIY